MDRSILERLNKLEMEISPTENYIMQAEPYWNDGPITHISRNGVRMDLSEFESWISSLPRNAHIVTLRANAIINEHWGRSK